MMNVIIHSEMEIFTSDAKTISLFTSKFQVPRADSHKGQNGKLLIIGGSELFHAASLWAAETAAYYVDMVHFCSTESNNELYQSAKHKFQNGIVVRQKDLERYIIEDNTILIGPGMIRSEIKPDQYGDVPSFADILALTDESLFAAHLTHFILKNGKGKKIVIDAGALQMINPEWLKETEADVILTPHLHEFERVFGHNLHTMNLDEKKKIVTEKAKTFRVTILLKAIDDIISDGVETLVIHGGNAGLTKGGSGDTLAGFTSALFATNDSVVSAVLASYLLKKSADILFEEKGYWYNIYDLIAKIPSQLKIITL